MLTQTIQTAANESLLAAQKAMPQYVHRISNVGHPCERFLYYCIHDWEKAKPLDPYALGAMRTGSLLEEKLLTIFNNEIGPRCSPQLSIRQYQTPTRDKLLEEYKISGTFDGVLVETSADGKNKSLGIVDIKTCSPTAFDAYDDLDSLKIHSWSSLYAAQVMLYAFSCNYDKGFLLFVNKSNLYQWKCIEVPIDLELVEQILQKCKRVNECLAANGEPPARLNQSFWCKQCKFEHYCLPEYEAVGNGLKVNEDEHLDNLVSRIIDLKPLAKEYEDCLKRFKESVVQGQDMIFEKAMVRWKEIHGVRQPQPGGEYSYWRMTLSELGENHDKDA